VSSTGPTGHSSALVIAHPGHELRVHHWLESARPTVFVLTDGSGRGGRSRLGSTRTVLERAGARLGSLGGSLTDGQAYAAILQGDAEPFVTMARALAGFFESDGIDSVVGDAAEGFNPSHDVCRIVVDAAVVLAGQRSGFVANYDFLLEGDPSAAARRQARGVLRLELDAAALDRKLAAAHGYPELRDETRAALARYGPAAFGTECLCPVSEAFPSFDGGIPYYEIYGQRQVEAGVYRQVIRHEQHMRPLATEIRRRCGLESSRADYSTVTLRST
jgi:hypothetical protein